MAAGSLVVVGLGIQAEEHLTPAARDAILESDVVMFAAADPFAVAMLYRLRPDSQDLFPFYADGPDRSETYARMKAAVMTSVRDGSSVCFAMYGHPGVFADAPHACVRDLRAEGFTARMLPGISAEACLFADLGVDPSRGLQSYEATSFLWTRPQIDTRAALLLWQVGAIGNLGWPVTPNADALKELGERLTELFGGRHAAIVYQAPSSSLLDPVIAEINVGAVADYDHPMLSTLYVPGKPSTGAAV